MLLGFCIRGGRRGSITLVGSSDIMADNRGTSRLRDGILEVKKNLQEGREKLLRQHRDHSPGIQVCAHLTDLLDTFMLDLFEAAMEAAGVSGQSAPIALVPYGGYGRREQAPYSDVDLMLLYDSKAENLARTLAQHLVRDISDLGVDLGFSMRTPQEASQLSSRDAVIFTSLVDSRFLGGSVGLYRKFLGQFAKMARQRAHPLVLMVEQARREERAKYGETVYLLEPNIKRSRGGLRDLQMIRWIGFARYGIREPELLQHSGLLTKVEYSTLRKTQEFLLKLRNELHFDAKTAHDVLYRADQIRIAEIQGYTGNEGQRPVEEFMQEYFSHTSSVRQIVGNFVEGARWRYPRLRRLAAMITSHRVGREFRVGPVHISATKKGLQSLRSNLADVLRLMELSGRYNCRIDHPTWQAIRQSMMTRQDVAVTEDTAKRFLSFLSQSNHLGRQLRQLHELRVLSKLVPGFEHSRCLLQFNEYHKYTVDEHSIQAVERATEFSRSDSVLGQACREIKSKHILHLALLVHDLGKGYPEDHSEVGARLALDVAKALFLSERETEMLRFLVHRHLMLPHLAFRRDTSDEAIILQHAAEIGSPTTLRMLFVLSCADLAAVGPGVLNEWKQDVLEQLYLRIMDHLTGGVTTGVSQRMAQRRAELLEDPRCKQDPAWFKAQMAELPAAYMGSPGSANTILGDLERLHSLRRPDAQAWGRFLPERNVSEYSVGVYEDTVSGIFHRLTGALSGQGLEILSAEIHTLADRLCLDRFWVQDSDFRGEPSQERFNSVCAALIKALQAPPGTPPAFRRTWQSKSRQSSIPLTDLPTKVRIDNATSDLYTIIDVFAHDRPGLLYDIGRTLFEQGLSVAIARIGTHLDQVVDVFYVIDSSGKKIESEEQIRTVREALLRSIAAPHAATS